MQDGSLSGVRKSEFESTAYWRDAVSDIIDLLGLCLERRECVCVCICVCLWLANSTPYWSIGEICTIFQLTRREGCCYWRSSCKNFLLHK